MSQQITVDVTADGEVSVRANGVKGTGCKALTAAIEQAIGVTTKDTKTGEFFQTAAASQGNQAKAGQ